jgi:DNA-binding transcriptional MerR regulator
MESGEGDRDAFKLDELAEAADVPVRTVRYYVQRGLLAPPVFRGRDTVYSRGHLLRLRAIKRLQDERFLPLDAIATELEGLSDQELSALLARLDRGGPLPAARQPDGGPYRMRPTATPTVAERWTRIRVGEGVELHVREDQVHHAEALADGLRELVTRRR